MHEKGAIASPRGGAAQGRPGRDGVIGGIGGIGGITIGDWSSVRGSRITVGAPKLVVPRGMATGREKDGLTRGIVATGPNGTNTVGTVTPVPTPAVGSN